MKLFIYVQSAETQAVKLPNSYVLTALSYKILSFRSPISLNRVFLPSNQNS